MRTAKVVDPSITHKQIQETFINIISPLLDNFIVPMRINFDEFDEKQMETNISFKDNNQSTILPTMFEHTLSTDALAMDAMEMDESIATFIRKQMEREQHSGNLEDNINTNQSSMDIQMPQQENNSPPPTRYTHNQGWADRQSLKYNIKRQILQKDLQKKLNNQGRWKKPQKPAKKKQSMNWVYSYKKHKCENIVSSAMKKETKELSEATHHPFLYPNKYNKSKKVSNTLSQKYSAYDKLYKEALKRELKKEMKREEEQATAASRKPKINDRYFQLNNKHYISLHKRVDEILEHQVNIKNKKRDLDETTGVKMFEPNLDFSKETYKMFHHSLSKQKITINKNKSSTNLKTIHQLTNPYNSMTEKYINNIDDRTLQYLANLFYQDSEQAIDYIEVNESVSKTVCKGLLKEQFDILQNFLLEIQEIQNNKNAQLENSQSKTMKSMASTSKGLSRISNILENQQILNKDEFKDKLSLFYEGLTLHDRQKLRNAAKRGIKQRSAIKINKKQSTATLTFKPIINVRSSSLDRISERYNEQLYYI